MEYYTPVRQTLASALTEYKFKFLVMDRAQLYSNEKGKKMYSCLLISAARHGLGTVPLYGLYHL